MIISHRHRFIFVKTMKTAGTSIEVYLSAHCGPDDVVTKIRPPVDGHVPRNHTGRWNPTLELARGAATLDARQLRTTVRDFRARRRFYNHLPATHIRSRVSPAIWTRYFRFTVDRNPWDKTLSHYHMLKAERQRPFTLDDYLDSGHHCRNLPIYGDRAGSPLVHRVLRYENLATEFGEVCAQLGIPFDGTLGVRAKAEYRQDRRHYSEVMTAAQRRTIEERHADEIRLHGYRY